MIPGLTTPGGNERPRLYGVYPALVTSVQGMQGTTPFQRWRNTPVLIASLLLLGWGLLSRRQRAA